MLLMGKNHHCHLSPLDSKFKLFSCHAEQKFTFLKYSFKLSSIPVTKGLGKIFLTTTMVYKSDAGWREAILQQQIIFLMCSGTAVLQ